MFWNLTLPLVLTAAVLAMHSVIRTKIVGSRLLARDQYYATLAARDQETKDRRLAVLFGTEFERLANERSRLRPSAEAAAASTARAAARERRTP